MTSEALPPHHENPLLEVFHPYISATVQALDAAGIRPEESWLDPMGPRDATIRLANSRALVWDEETGWRHGEFVRGEMGVRTELRDTRHLGNGLLPEPGEVAASLTADAAALPRKYRDHDDDPETFDARVRRLYG